MMQGIPDWAVERLKAVYEEHGRVWKTTRPALKPLWKELGFKPSAQVIYDILNEVSDSDRVAPCGKAKRFDGFWDGYRFCGKASVCECARTQVSSTSKETYSAKDESEFEAIKEKRLATMRDRYGVDYTAQSSELRDKMAATNRLRYGVDSSLGNAEVRAKAQATIKDRYGVDNVSHLPAVVEKRSRTNVARYGGNSPLSSAEVRAKGKETLLATFGVDHAMKAPEVRERVRETVLERYGVDYLQQSPEMREMSKATMLERYGVETALLHPEFQNKRKATNLERFGVEHAVQSSEVKEKTAATNMGRYGSEFPSTTEEVKARARNTNIDRYGRVATSQCHISPESLAVLESKANLSAALTTKSIKTIAIETGVHPATVCRYCKQHGIPLPKSSYEREIQSFLEQFDVMSLANVRGIVSFKNDRVCELDFYIPSQRLAIEFNGIYWHSSIFKDRGYHRDKFETCRDARIRLFMINEDEWNARPSTIKSTIAHLLGRSEKGLAARKLKMRPIPANIANSFFAGNHIQGATGSIIYAIGAFEGDTLVGAMAFNNQRGTGAIELIRFCSDGKARAGLFSRLFKHAVRSQGYDEILSFADLRYSEGDVYRKNGFELAKEIPPDYRYVVGDRTYHKSSYTKDKLNKIDPATIGMTERQATEYLGIPRIYDCGKLKFIWRSSSTK